jgi:hypothetical protein
MALGSIVTLAVIVAAAVEGPKFLRTHAAGNPKATVQETAPPSNPPSPAPVPATTAPAQTTPGADTIASQSTGQTAPATVPAESSTNTAATTTQPPSPSRDITPNKKLASIGQNTAAQSHAQTTAVSQPDQASQATSQQLTEVRREYNSLAISVNSAKESLHSIKEQMAKQGLGLRSDVREAETRMTYLLNEAKDKLKNGDAEGAKHDLEMAQMALNQVEKFLGH